MAKVMKILQSSRLRFTLPKVNKDNLRCGKEAKIYNVATCKQIIYSEIKRHIHVHVQ